jgi:glycosyltransferase involved in cell wall biosynthesis
VDSRVLVTGFLPESAIPGLYEKTRLVLAPFRSTTGSGSIPRAFAHGAPVLASDLPLNVEIGRREPGALALFRACDAQDCARRIRELCADPAALAGLSAAARRYARVLTLERAADQYAAIYRELLSAPA